MSPSVSVRLLLTQSDARLVALARAGHERAFEALVERYRRPLLGYCRRLLLPHERAEDALQQGLLQAWQALRDGAEVRDVKPWLYRIVHNAALNMRRSGYDYAQLSETLSGAGAPPEDLNRRIAVREALAGLAALPEMQREALLRTAVHGDSYQEAATTLGMSEGAVRGLVHRARAALRTATTALTPSPLLGWALGSGSADAPLAGRLAAGAGSGSAGLVAGLLKVTATAVTAGVVVGGVGVSRDRRDAGHHADRAVPAVSRETAGEAGGRELALGGSRARANPTVPSRPGSPSPRSPTFAAQRRGRRDLQAGHTPRRRHWLPAPVSQPAAPHRALPLSRAEAPAARPGDGGGDRQPGADGGSSSGGGGSSSSSSSSGLGSNSATRQGSGSGDGGAAVGEHSSYTASPDRHQTSDGGHDGSSESSSSQSSSGDGQSENGQGPVKPDGHSQEPSLGSQERRGAPDQGSGSTPSPTGEGGATNPDSNAAGGERPTG
jgi:RNA polymerase sigma factor (sigma-70 family)